MSSVSSLQEFNPETDIPTDFMMMFLGMRRSGKNTAMLHMLETMKDRLKYHRVEVISATCHTDPEQWKHFPQVGLFDEVRNMEPHLASLLDEQQHAISEEVIRQIRSGPTHGGVEPEKLLETPGEDFSRQPDEKRVTKKKKGKKRKMVVRESKHNKETASKRMKKVKGRVKEAENKTVTQFVNEKQADPEITPKMKDPISDFVNNRPGFRISPTQIELYRRTHKIDETRMPRMLVILDDVVHDNAVRHSAALTQLAVAGRHYYISVILLSQNVCGSGCVPPPIRNNCDFILVACNPRSSRERALLAEQYLTVAGVDSSAGLRLLRDIASVKHRNMVVDCTETMTHNGFRDYVFKYGPVPAPPKNVSPGFKLGNEKQWEDDKKIEQEEDNFNAADKPRGPTGSTMGARSSFIAPGNAGRFYRVKPHEQVGHMEHLPSFLS